MPARIIFVRHGETDDNLNKVFQGWRDTPLNEAGHAQAKLAASKLQKERVDAIYSSDLSRCYHTALPIAKALQLEIKQTKVLRENDMGVFSGWCWEEPNQELEALWQEMLESRKQNDLTWNKHQGESYQAHLDRARKFLTFLSEHHPGQTVLAVTHGGTLNRLMEAVNYKTHHDYYGYGNTSISVLTKSEGSFTVTLHDDTTHLKGSAFTPLKSNDN